MVIFTTLFRRFSTLKMAALFQCFLMLSTTLICRWFDIVNSNVEIDKLVLMLIWRCPTSPHVASCPQNVGTTFTFCKDVTQIWHRIIYFRNSKQYISPQEKLPLQSGGATVSDWHWQWRDDFRCNKCKHYKYCFVLAISKAIAKAIYIHTTILHGFLLL